MKLREQKSPHMYYLSIAKLVVRILKSRILNQAQRKTKLNQFQEVMPLYKDHKLSKE